MNTEIKNIIAILKKKRLSEKSTESSEKPTSYYLIVLCLTALIFIGITQIESPSKHDDFTQVKEALITMIDEERSINECEDFLVEKINKNNLKASEISELLYLILQPTNEVFGCYFSDLQDMGILRIEDSSDDILRTFIWRSDSSHYNGGYEHLMLLREVVELDEYDRIHRVDFIKEHLRSYQGEGGEIHSFKIIPKYSEEYDKIYIIETTGMKLSAAMSGDPDVDEYVIINGNILYKTSDDRHL